MTIACLAFFLSIAKVSAQPAAPATYEVVAGDTWIGIARRELGEGRRWRDLIAANPEVPPNQMVPPGTILRLPGRTAQTSASPDAEVTDIVRAVESQAPAATEWRAASPGQDLYRGWRVNTRDRSAAELTFRDTSQIHMRENTLVIIFGGTSEAARRATTRARLERGSLRSAITRLRLDVEMPESSAELAAGSAIVSVDETGAARVANHEGAAARMRAAGAAVAVRAGYGSLAVRGSRPSRPRPLPPPPAWRAGQPDRFVALGLYGATAAGGWEPVPAARLYRVEVRDRARGRVLAATEVPAEVTEFELHHLPPGDYDVRVATIDGDLFEGRPSSAFAIAIALVEVVGPDGSPVFSAAPDPTEAPAALTLPLGTTLRAPPEASCRVAGEPAREIMLSRAGAFEIACAGAGPYRNVAVVVPPFTIEAAGSEGFATLERGVRGTVTLRLQSGTPPPGLRVVAPTGWVIGELAVDGDTLSFDVTPPAGAPESARLTLALGATDLASVPLAVTARSVAAEPPVASARRPLFPLARAYDFTASPVLLGLRERGRSTRLGASLAYIGDPLSDEGAFSWMLGGTVGLGPIGLSIDAVIAPGEQPSRFEGTRADARFGFGFGVLDEPRVALDSDLYLWAPFGDEEVRIGSALQLSWFPIEELAIRTRQGAQVSALSTSAYWQSAYGIDVWPVEYVALAAELELAIGESDRDGVFGGAGAITATFALDRVDVWLSGRLAFGAQLRDRAGDATITAGASFRVGREP